MNIHISGNIKYLRLKHNLSLEELGKHISLSGAAINNMEHKRNLPSLTVLIALVDYFKVNLHDLVFSNMADSVVITVEESSPKYGLEGRLVHRLERMLSEMENKIKTECPDCAKKLNLT